MDDDDYYYQDCLSDPYNEDYEAHHDYEYFYHICIVAIRDRALLDVIEQQNYKAFRDWIIREDFNINHVDNQQRSLLLQLSCIPNCEQFVIELIAHGADIHLTDHIASSFLHLAVREKRVHNLKAVQLLLEKGVDVNGQDHRGLTPLYIACVQNNIDLVYLLLYYGADPNIPSHEGLLPANVVDPETPEKKLLLEILCLYSFDDDCEILLPTLAGAMWREESPLFSVIVDRSPKIICDDDGIDYFCRYFYDVKARHFKVFVEKFKDTFEELIDSVDLLQVVVNYSMYFRAREAYESFNFLVDGPYVSQLVLHANSENFLISDYIRNAASRRKEEEVHKRIFFLLSLGLHVTLEDLNAVYFHYKICDLFMTILHLDIIPTPEDYVWSMVRLHYHPELDVEDCHSYDWLDSLSYFNSPKIKNKAYEMGTKSVLRMPTVRSLVELSRNAARKFILKRFKVKGCKEFLCVLNGLPIDRVTKSILALEKKLYCDVNV